MNKANKDRLLVRRSALNTQSRTKQNEAILEENADSIRAMHNNVYGGDFDNDIERGNRPQRVTPFSPTDRHSAERQSRIGQIDPHLDADGIFSIPYNDPYATSKINYGEDRYGYKRGSKFSQERSLNTPSSLRNRVANRWSQFSPEGTGFYQKAAIGRANYIIGEYGHTVAPIPQLPLMGNLKKRPKSADQTTNAFRAIKVSNKTALTKRQDEVLEASNTGNKYGMFEEPTGPLSAIERHRARLNQGIDEINTDLDQLKAMMPTLTASHQSNRQDLIRRARSRNTLSKAPNALVSSGEIVFGAGIEESLVGELVPARLVYGEIPSMYLGQMEGGRLTGVNTNPQVPFYSGRGINSGGTSGIINRSYTQMRNEYMKMKFKPNSTLVFNLFNEEEVYIASQLLEERKTAKSTSRLAKLAFIIPERLENDIQARVLWDNILTPHMGMNRADFSSPTSMIDLAGAKAGPGVSGIVVSSYEESIKFLQTTLDIEQAQTVVGDTPTRARIHYPGQAGYSFRGDEWREISLHGSNVETGNNKVTPIFDPKRPTRPQGYKANNYLTIYGSHGLEFDAMTTPSARGIALGPSGGIPAGVEPTFRYGYSEHELSSKIEAMRPASKVLQNGRYVGDLVDVHQSWVDQRLYERITYRSVDDKNRLIMHSEEIPTWIRHKKFIRNTTLISEARNDSMNRATNSILPETQVVNRITAGEGPKLSPLALNAPQREVSASRLRRGLRPGDIVLKVGRFYRTRRDPVLPTLGYWTRRSSQPSRSSVFTLRSVVNRSQAPRRILSNTDDLTKHLTDIALSSKAGRVTVGLGNIAPPLTGLDIDDLSGTMTSWGGNYREAAFVQAMLTKRSAGKVFSDAEKSTTAMILGRLSKKFNDLYPDDPLAVISELFRENPITGRLDGVDILSSATDINTLKLMRQMMGAISSFKGGDPANISAELASGGRYSLKHFQLSQNTIALDAVWQNQDLTHFDALIKNSSIFDVFDKYGDQYQRDIIEESYKIARQTLSPEEADIVFSKLMQSNIQFSSEGGLESYLETLQDKLRAPGDNRRYQIIGQTNEPLTRADLDPAMMVREQSYGVNRFSGSIIGESLEDYTKEAINYLTANVENPDNILSNQEMEKTILQIYQEAESHGKKIVEGRTSAEELSRLSASDVVDMPHASFREGGIMGGGVLRGGSRAFGVSLQYEKNLTPIGRLMSERSLTSGGQRWSLPLLKEMGDGLRVRGVFPKTEHALEIFELYGRKTLEGSLDAFMAENIIHNQRLSNEMKQWLIADTNVSNLQVIENENLLNNAVVRQGREKRVLSQKGAQAIHYLEGQMGMETPRSVKIERFKQIFPELQDVNKGAAISLHNALSQVRENAAEFEKQLRPAVSAYFTTSMMSVLSKFLPGNTAQKQTDRITLLASQLRTTDRNNLVWGLDGFGSADDVDHMHQTVRKFRSAIHKGSWAKAGQTGSVDIIDPMDMKSAKITLENLLDHQPEWGEKYQVGNAKMSVDTVYDALVRASVARSADTLGWNATMSNDVSRSILLNTVVDPNADLSDYFMQEHEIFKAFESREIISIITRGEEAENNIRNLELAGIRGELLAHTSAYELQDAESLPNIPEALVRYNIDTDETTLADIRDLENAPARFLIYAQEKARKWSTDPHVRKIAEDARRLF